jgi:hypothetical protein
MSLQDCIDDVADTIGAISGIRAAPHEPPEAISAYPTVITYPGAGEYRTGEPAGMLKYLGDIVVELHLARKDLPRDVAKVATYERSIPNDILEDTTLGGHCSTCGPVTSSGLIAMEWDVPTIGIRYVIKNVKIQAAFT